MRTVVLGLSVGFTALLAFLTCFVLFTSGPDVLVIISGVVVVVIGFGLFGALTGPPPEP